MNIPNLAVAADRKKVLVKEEKLDMNIRPIYKGKKYFLRTYGCQMNDPDSEEIKYYLESLGYEYDEFMKISSGSLKNIFYGENLTKITLL